MKNKIALTVAVALAAPAMAAKVIPTGTTSAEIEQKSQVQHYKPLKRQVTPAARTQHFIVQLDDAPLATYQGGIANYAATAAPNGAKLQANSVDSKSYRQLLQQRQSDFKGTLKSRLPSTKVIGQFSTVFNGVAVAANGATMAQLAALPGVKSVYPERIYYAQMDRSLELISAATAWDQLEGRSNAGQGVKVAVIDSGIRPENPMFDDADMAPPASRPSDDYCAQFDPGFCNNKLIAARWSIPTFPVAEQEYMSPLGFDGHGTHVAGTAVGNVTDIEFEGEQLTISGVAPGAYLMSYKALYATASDPTRASGSNIMLLEALEHAVNDGADVINNSWGGGAGADPATSPYQQAFEAAEAAGVVVVSAAGNDGAGPQTIGCPGCIESGITVANTTHGRFFANEVTIGSLTGLLSIEGVGSAQLSEDLTAPVISAVSVDAENAEGCAPFADASFNGAIALISRGTCFFQDKIDNATAAGAVGLIVHNNRAGQPISMSLGDTTIPAVMISQTDGEAALTEIGSAEMAPSATMGAEITRITNDEFADATSSSSSRGPNGNPNILKPDIAAPGTSILSAMSPDEIGNEGNNFALLGGTSMASPHVAGAAALVRAMHPEWSALEIKTALTSSANNMGINKEDAATPADPFDVGAGRLDLSAASAAVLTFDKASFADASCVTECRFMVAVTNRGESEATWAVTATVDDASSSVSSDSVTLMPNESTNVELIIDTTFSAKDAWLFGQLNFSGDSNAHLPVALYPEASSDASQLAFVSEPSITYGEVGELSATFVNKNFDGTVLLRMDTPDEVSFVAGSGEIMTSGAATNGQEVNDEQGFISWIGRLDSAELTASLVAGSGVPSFASADNQISCTGGCDEVSFSFDLPPFEYNGQTYTSVTISDNGIVIPEAGQDTSGTWNNQQLPSDIAPNNVIAPFWSDFDLNDGSADDTGSGTLHIYGAGNYVVVEWNNVATWVPTGAEDSGNRYTFQLFLGYGDAIGDNWFNYVQLDALPAALTIGVEDVAGALGASVYYNGNGDAPVTDSYVQISTVAGGTVNFAAQATANVVDVAADDMLEAEEDATSTLDLVSNDSDVITVPLNVIATHDGQTLEAIQLLDIGGAMPAAITITAEPMNGSVVVNEDLSVDYTPVADYFGEDSFSYDALDELGTVIGSATATIMVNNVNDAPMVEQLVQASAFLGTTATIELIANDVDGDELTWSAQQTEGPEVEFSIAANLLTFTVPEVAEGTVVSFAVTANDGEMDSEPVTVSAVVQPLPPEGNDSGDSGSSSGSMGWLSLMLLGLALGRRR